LTESPSLKSDRRFYPGGSITPKTHWLLYGENQVAPLTRKQGGSFTVKTQWLYRGEN